VIEKLYDMTINYALNKRIRSIVHCVRCKQAKTNSTVYTLFDWIITDQMSSLTTQWLRVSFTGKPNYNISLMANLAW